MSLTDLVKRRVTGVCGCPDCLSAGCTTGPILLKRTKRQPERWLHGRDLRRWIAREDQDAARRTEVFERLKHDLRAKGFKAQRGDEPR